jgi:DNA-binding NarL/FixJ family response regulator
LSPRVLVVDDHELWRQAVTNTLGHSRRCHIVGEAQDGVQAIEQAAALQPDLVLLDVELPAMNGIEAARRIRDLAPAARILFVSAYRTWDIVEAAFATGARGYLVKSDFGDGWLPAVNALVGGRRFVSATLTGRGQGWTPSRAARHEIGFYADESLLAAGYTRFAQAALDAGKALILCADQSRGDAVHCGLQAAGIDVALADRQRRVFRIGVDDAFSTFIIDGSVREDRFWEAATSLVARAAGAARCAPPGVAVCGDGTATLLREGKVDAAIQLERLWNEVASTFNVDVFCPYLTTDIQRHQDPAVMHRLCREHTAVVG